MVPVSGEFVLLGLAQHVRDEEPFQWGDGHYPETNLSPPRLDPESGPYQPSQISRFTFA